VIAIVNAALKYCRTVERAEPAPPPTSHVGPPEPPGNDVIRDARSALIKMGWPIPVATTAVDRARTETGDDAELVTMVRVALKHCPAPAHTVHLTT
jgi:hypothetical protein